MCHGVSARWVVFISGRFCMQFPASRSLDTHLITSSHAEERLAEEEFHARFIENLSLMQLEQFDRMAVLRGDLSAWIHTIMGIDIDPNELFSVCSL